MVDENGQPVPGVILQFLAAPSLRWTMPPTTDAQGRTNVLNCPAGGRITVIARHEGFEELHQDVDPSVGEIELRLHRVSRQPHARIVGKIVGPDGTPVANATASAHNENAVRGGLVVATGNDGRFELDSVQPGRNRVSIGRGDLPDFASDYRQVAPGATLDPRPITPPRGGVALVSVHGEAIASAQLFVRTATADGGWDVGEQAGRLCTKRLAPGDYLLCVDGEGVAAQTVSFAIRDGEDTIVEVTTSPGITQPLALTAPPTTAADWRLVTIHGLPQQTVAAITSIAP